MPKFSEKPRKSVEWRVRGRELSLLSAYLRLDLARKANSNSRTEVTVGLEKRLFTHPHKLHLTQARFSSYIA